MVRKTSGLLRANSEIIAMKPARRRSGRIIVLGGFGDLVGRVVIGSRFVSSLGDIDEIQYGLCIYNGIALDNGYFRLSLDDSSISAPQATSS
jgi:hypothetical protein